MKIETFEIIFQNQNVAFAKIKSEFEAKEKEILYPVSNEILERFSANISLVFISMIENAKSYNLYSASILYRSLIEHFFKAFYIFEKTITTKSDEVAENFQKHYLISEFLAKKAGFLDMEDLQKGNSTRTDFIKFLVSKFPEFEGFDKENQKEISVAVKQFNLREIIKYFHHLTKNKAQGSDVIAQMIPEYSRVSTFTHGGMYANSLMDKYSNDNSVEDELARIIEISLISTSVLKESILLTYKPDNEIAEAFIEIKKFRP